MLTLEKCCCCSLRVGCIIIGVLKLLQCIINSSSTFILHAHGHKPVAGGWLSHVISIIVIILCVLYLWFGVREHQAWASIMFLVYVIFEGICSLIAAIAMLVPGGAAMLGVHGIAWSFGIAMVIVVFLNAYYAVVIYSYMNSDEE